MKKGFSLIELLVVIAIISLLAGIVLPNVMTVRARGRDSKRIADVSQIRLAIEHYFNIKDKFPLKLTDADFIASGVLSQVPVDPNATVCSATDESGCYKYVAFCTGGSSTPNGFHVGATLEQNNEQLSADGDASAASTNFCTGGATADFDGTESPTLKSCAGATVTVGGCYDFKE